MDQDKRPERRNEDSRASGRRPAEQPSARRSPPQQQRPNESQRRSTSASRPAETQRRRSTSQARTGEGQRRTTPPAQEEGLSWRPEDPTEAPRKQPRGKKRRGGVFANPLIYLLFVFGLSAILAALGWTAANDVLALNKTYVQDIVLISEEDDFGDIVDQLKDKGLIEYKSLFNLFATMMGASDTVSPGAYVLDTDMDYRAIINGMSSSSGSKMPTRVTIPEGYNIDQIFQLLQDEGVSSVTKLRDTAANHAYNFSFLEELPMGDYKRLEGYLFPDTYDFYMGEDPLYVINKMLINFDSKFTDALREQVGGSRYSIHEVVIMASMIEKETDGGDRANISSVIHNRMERPNSESNGKLQIDATLQYVLPEGEYVTQADYEGLDSPYNTYLHQGLPPGPIANPGMDSILAAINPSSTGYYYYALGTDGKHQFSNTYAQHQSFLSSLAGGQ